MILQSRCYNEAMEHPFIPAYVNKILEEFLVEVQIILGNNFIGSYIGGSLANNAFNPETSDIDLYVILKDELTDKEFASLEKLHKKIYSSGTKGATKLETSYIPQKHLVNFKPTDTRPYFNDGKFQLATYGNNWLIELHLLREKGIPLSGPSVKALVPEVSNEALNNAIHKNLNEYWVLMLNDEDKLKRPDYQVFATLTMCRTLYTLVHGTITSKQKAAEWAKNKLSSEFSDLIIQAVLWKPNDKFDHHDDVKKLIQHTLGGADISFADQMK